MPSPEPRPSSDFRPTGPIRGVPTTNPGAGGIPLEGGERASSDTNQFQGMASPKNGYAAATSTSLRGVDELRIACISEIQRNLDGGPGHWPNGRRPAVLGAVRIWGYSCGSEANLGKDSI